jgi:hypothetical protein
MLPIWLKLSYSAFVTVLVPVYTRQYGWANFLWFSDVALLLGCVAVWLGRRRRFLAYFLGTSENGAKGGIRTPTLLRAPAPQAGASASSATFASRKVGRSDGSFTNPCRRADPGLKTRPTLVAAAVPGRGRRPAP